MFAGLYSSTKLYHYNKPKRDVTAPSKQPGIGPSQFTLLYCAAKVVKLTSLVSCYFHSISFLTQGLDIIFKSRTEVKLKHRDTVSPCQSQLSPDRAGEEGRLRDRPLILLSSRTLIILTCFINTLASLFYDFWQKQKHLLEEMKKFQIFKKTKTLLFMYAYNNNIQADLRGK